MLHVCSGEDAAATVLFQVKKAVAGAAVGFEMELPAVGTVKDLMEALVTYLDLPWIGTTWKLFASFSRRIKCHFTVAKRDFNLRPLSSGCNKPRLRRRAAQCSSSQW